MGSMARIRIFPIVLALTSFAVVCATVEAQTAQDSSGREIEVKPARESPSSIPFSPGAEIPEQRIYSIEFRSSDQMTQRDRDLEADAESSIRERAGFDGLEFNQGNWSYQQLICPALPNHMFLKFMRNNGAGDMSVFTVSIPRGGDGRVRIIPVLRRGYSLFSPAPINAMTISAFNHIRAEDHPDGSPDWLTTGLCYAALAGAHPQAAPQTENEKGTVFPAAMSAVLQVPIHGGAIIRFADVAATPRPMEWTMIFDDKGKLLKASHSPASLVIEKLAPPIEVDVNSRAETP